MHLVVKTIKGTLFAVLMTYFGADTEVSTWAMAIDTSMKCVQPPVPTVTHQYVVAMETHMIIDVQCIWLHAGMCNNSYF